MYIKNPTTLQISDKLEQAGNISLEGSIIIISNTNIDEQADSLDMSQVEVLEARGTGLNMKELREDSLDSWWFTKKEDGDIEQDLDVPVITIQSTLYYDCLEIIAEVFNRYRTISAELFVHTLARIFKDLEVDVSVRFKVKGIQDLFFFKFTHEEVHCTGTKYNYLTAFSGSCEENVHLSKVNMMTGEIIDIATLTRRLNQTNVLYYDLKMSTKEVYDLESKDFIFNYVKQIANDKLAVVHVSIKNDTPLDLYSDTITGYSNTRRISNKCFCVYPTSWNADCKAVFFSTDDIKPIEDGLYDFDEVASFLLECKQNEKTAILIPLNVTDATLQVLKQLEEVYNQDKILLIILRPEKGEESHEVQPWE